MALAAPAAVALGEQLPHLAPGLEPGSRATHKLALVLVLALVRALVHLETQRSDRLLDPKDSARPQSASWLDKKVLLSEHTC